jgi:hypothetical protein
MSDNQHHGSCHCGAVKFDVKLDLDKPALTCNCSICQRSGTMLAFVPAADFELKTGADHLTDYQFGKKKIHHLFCQTCGIKSFARGERDGHPVIAVNVRCLEDVDLAVVPTRMVNGRGI